MKLNDYLCINNLKQQIMNEVKDIKTVEYHREPNEFDIKFGEGAIHYIDVPESVCRKQNGDLKKWVNFQGARYYY